MSESMDSRRALVVATGYGSDVQKRTSLVMITRNRCEGALATVERLLSLPESPPAIVVDNESTDGTVPALRRRFGARVTIVPLTGTPVRLVKRRRSRS